MKKLTDLLTEKKYEIGPKSFKEIEDKLPESLVHTIRNVGMPRGKYYLHDESEFVSVKIILSYASFSREDLEYIINTENTWRINISTKPNEGLHLEFNFKRM